MSLLRSLGFFCLSSSIAIAQAPVRKGAAPATSHANQPVTDQLVALQQQQVEALKSGDPAQSATATKPYLAEVLRRLGLVAATEGMPDRAAALYIDAINLLDTPDRRVDAAGDLLRIGQSAKAHDLLVPVLNGPLENNARAWTLAGMAARSSNKQSEAVTDFQHALRLSQDINVAYALGAALLAAHDQAQADRVFSEILRDTHQNPTWEIAIGDAYRDARYYEPAVIHFKAALARDPRAPHAEFLLGYTYLQMNEWGVNAQSFEHFRNAVAASPREYISNFYLGALESTDGSDLPSSDRHLLAATKADATQPEAWLYLGLNANRQHRNEDTETYLRRAIQLTGDDEARNGFQIRRAYFTLGRLLVSQGKREEGQQLLAKYKTAESKAVAASGDAIAQQALSEGDHPAATIFASDSVIGSTPVSSVPNAAMLRQSESQAQALAQGKATLTRMASDGWNDLGTAQARQQDYSAALVSFQHSEALGQPSSATLRNLGVAAFRLDQNTEAARAFDLYFQSAPDRRLTDSRAELMLGLAQFDLGRFQPAALAFTAAPKETMADPRAAYSWAYSLAHTGQAQEANALARQLMDQQLPTDVSSLVCHIYVDDEDYEDSLRCYRSLTAQEPSALLAHYEAANALIHLDRAQESLAELKAEQAISPDNPNVDYLYAFALLQISRKEEARSLLTNLISKHPEHAQAQYQLGKLLLDAGDTQEAVQHLEASEAADSSSDYTHYQLGTAYKKAGRTADAEREFALYREIKDAKRAAAAGPTSK
jgi:tetratricopeptide (TPR) repeat protein